MSDDGHSPRVVITGIGAVCAYGWGVASLRDGLAAGRTGIAETRRFDTAGHRTRVAGEVPEPPAGLVSDIAGWQALSQCDRFAVAAAHEACTQARWPTGSPDTGLFFGGSTAGMLECEEYLRRLVGVSEGPPRLSLLVSQQVNGPGDAVARQRQVSGPVKTVSSACSSGALAIGAALEAIRDGEVAVAIAGGADGLCQLTYAGFNSLRSVDEKACRPFRQDRAGLSIGEGAGVLVLEDLDHARARGVSPLAELKGSGASCDAHHMTAPHPEGEGAARAIRAALDDAAVAARDIQMINAHGTGTPLNDTSEANAIRTIFGDKAATTPVTASKGSVGHLLGCSGAIEAVITVLCLMDGHIYHTPGGGTVDRDAAVDLVLGQARPIAGDALAVSTSFAFGGANAALILRGWARGETP